MSPDQKMPTLWVVTEVYYPEEISTGYYLTSIAEGLAKERTVKVLTGQPKHMARGTRAQRHEIHNGVEIFRTWGTTLDKNVLFFRLINMAAIGLSMFFASLKRFKRGDHILVVTAPPSLPVTTALACLIKGAGYTLLVQDSYPEILVAVSGVKANSLIVRTAHFLNRWVYKHVSRIIVMGRDMRELFTRKTNGLDIPLVTIPNWADLESIEVTERETNPLLQKLGIEKKLVFLYAGNIGHPTDVETIIQAAEELRSREDIHFLFIGAGAKKPLIEAQKQAKRLDNVTILDYMPRSEQNEFLGACDVGLVALIPGMWGTAMPSRTYNIMAAGRPILALCDQESELAHVIDEDGIGWHIEPRDPQKLVNLILEIDSHRAGLSVLGERARGAAVEKYSPAAAIAAYRSALS